MNHKEKLQNISRKPGVYMMKDKDGVVLYVGKAKNLKNRVTSYFQRDLPSPWIGLMVDQIDDIETIVVTNEFEALLLENNLIKKYHPQYNIRLKDDKTFPFIKLTNEEFPRITIVRKITKDGGKYFGPYLSAWSLRQTIQFIRRNFGIVTHSYKVGQRACLNYQLGLCSSPYAGKISKADYENRVKSTVKFLKGDYRELLKELEDLMKIQSRDMNFEAAAKTRDQISSVNRLVETQNIVSTNQKNRDIFAVYKLYDIGTCTVMKVRGGKLLYSNTLSFDEAVNFTESDMLQAVLNQYYINNMDIGREILVNAEVEDLTMIVSAFEHQGVRTSIVMPKMGEKKKLVELALENAIERATQLLAKNHKTQQILDSLQKDLKLEKSPIRIEAYDISNLGASSAVGAMITFVNGVPHKDHYRKFIIKTVDGQNDYAMMKEILTRRFKNAELPKPNLILIDGGKGQLNAACSVLNNLGLKMPIIGLAKQYELIYIPGSEKPIALDYNSESLLLMRAIRDEVHRFGISFHRERRGKEFLK